MKTTKKLFAGIIAMLLLFSAYAQNDDQDQNQGMFQDQELSEEQTQDNQMPEMQEDRVQGNQLYEYHDQQNYGGGDLEEALLSAGKAREWDNSGDGKFDAAEFYVVLYRIWDKNNDGKLNQDEWDYGLNNFLTEYNRDEFGGYEDWDEDGNNEVDVNEFARSIEKAELYNASAPDMSQNQNQADTEMGMNTEEFDNSSDQTAMEQEFSSQDSQLQNNEPADAIVIWERRGVVEKIEYGDETINLSGRQDSDNIESDIF